MGATEESDRGVAFLDPWLGRTEEHTVVWPDARIVHRALPIGSALTDEGDPLEDRAHNHRRSRTGHQYTVEGHVKRFIDLGLKGLDISPVERALESFGLA